EAVGVGLEPQGHQQLAQGAAAAGEERYGDVLAPRLAQQRDGAAARSDADQPLGREALYLRGVVLPGAVEVGHQAAVPFDPWARGDDAPQARGLRRVGDARRLTALDAHSPPPLDLDHAAEGRRLEQVDRGLVARRQAHLPESLLARLLDRRVEHRPRDATPAVAARHAQALVPDQARRVRPDALPADHGAADVRPLDLRPRAGDPAVAPARHVLATLPPFAGGAQTAGLV